MQTSRVTTLQSSNNLQTCKPCYKPNTSVFAAMTGGLLNWRVWYLGLVWLLMESALFGIIFWYAW